MKLLEKESPKNPSYVFEGPRKNINLQSRECSHTKHSHSSSKLTCVQVPLPSEKEKICGKTCLMEIMVFDSRTLWIKSKVTIYLWTFGVDLIYPSYYRWQRDYKIQRNISSSRLCLNWKYVLNIFKIFLNFQNKFNSNINTKNTKHKY